VFLFLKVLPRRCIHFSSRLIHVIFPKWGKVVLVTSSYFTVIVTSFYAVCQFITLCQSACRCHSSQNLILFYIRPWSSDMTQGQDALYRDRYQALHPNSLHSGVTYWECRSKVRNSPTPVQVSVLLKFRAVLYGTTAICVVPNPVARGANLLFFQGKFSLPYVIKGQKVLLINY
jgi:hypothetical protein